MAELDARFVKAENYVNRELSWLDFDYRILEEARDKTIPLFERPHFLSSALIFYQIGRASCRERV